MALGFDLALQCMGQGKVHIVAAQQNVFPDGDPVQFQFLREAAGRLGDGDEAEVGRAAADVADEDEIARGNLMVPGNRALVGLRVRDPGIEGCLRFLEQRDAAKPGGERGFMGERTGHFVERRRHRQHHVAVLQIGIIAALVQVVHGRMAHVFEIAARGFQWRHLPFRERRLPGQDRRAAIHMRIAEPGFRRCDQAVRHEGGTLAGEGAHHRGHAFRIVPGQGKSSLRVFAGRGDVQGGGKQRLFANHLGRQDLGDLDAARDPFFEFADGDAGVGGAEIDS